MNKENREQISGEKQVALLFAGVLFGVIVALCVTLISTGIFGGGTHNYAVFGASWLGVLAMAARRAKVLP